MTRQMLVSGLLAIILVGCGEIRNVALPTGGNTDAPNTRGPITLSGGGSPNLSSPAPIQQTPASAQNWRRDLPRNIAYFNLGNTAVTIYDSAEQTSSTGTLLPGEGGYIRTCDDTKPVCRMDFGNGRQGWVQMSSMAGVSG
ncbi:hypothetical protein [Sagittula sp. SSi028]|uniref:hypothetical protein n=1 Tax=Sagittula sp. SSi028 TaxID=3400636 RepID=UPI003AF60FC1